MHVVGLTLTPLLQICSCCLHDRFRLQLRGTCTSTQPSALLRQLPLLWHPRQCASHASAAQWVGQVCPCATCSLASSWTVAGAAVACRCSYSLVAYTVTRTIGACLLSVYVCQGAGRGGGGGGGGKGSVHQQSSDLLFVLLFASICWYQALYMLPFFR